MTLKGQASEKTNFKKNVDIILSEKYKIMLYSHSYSLVMKPKRCNFWRGISLISIVKGFSKIGLSAVTKGEIAISVKSFY